MNSFKVNPDALSKDLRIFVTRLKTNAKLRVRNANKEELYNNGEPVSGFFSILRTSSGKWYLCLPRIKEPPVYENAVYKSVFLDPGVRTFQTFYSPDGVCGKIGAGFSKSLESLARKHAKLQSVAYDSTCKAQKRYKLRLLCAKIREKIANKVKDLHWQTCNFLCKAFQNIFIPIFKVSEMVEGSPLGRDVTRKILQLSHGAFRERLLWYAKTKHRNVFVIQEHYTTKTCGVCGHEQNMEGEKTYKCQKCKSSIDRDYNGSRNVCISVFTALKSLEETS